MASGSEKLMLLQARGNLAECLALNVSVDASATPLAAMPSADAAKPTSIG